MSCQKINPVLFCLYIFLSLSSHSLLWHPPWWFLSCLPRYICTEGRVAKWCYFLCKCLQGWIQILCLKFYSRFSFVSTHLHVQSEIQISLHFIFTVLNILGEYTRCTHSMLLVLGRRSGVSLARDIYWGFVCNETGEEISAHPSFEWAHYHLGPLVGRKEEESAMICSLFFFSVQHLPIAPNLSCALLHE